MDYNPGILFETSIVNMDKGKELTNINQLEKSNPRQQKRSRCGPVKHLQITSKDFHVELALRKETTWPWGWDYINKRQRSQNNN